jgi:HK97 family phage prohead protease
VSERAAGKITNPGGTERLHEYWVHGEGAAKIRWGEPGDFDRCVLHLGKFIKDPKGYCNLAHHAALGIYPATHAKELKGRSGMADKKPEDQPDEGRAESLAPYFRSFPLEDISVRSGGDGRTVEAYAAVFGVTAPVRDQDGEYTEELDPACFNRAISDAAPHGSRRNWKIGVFYNHGMTITGAPSERHSMPIGKIVDIKADNRGLWTEVRYNRTQLADEVLENIREGSIPGYSFTGVFRRSSPLIPRSGFRRNYRTGDLPHVRRLESTLMELGPTPIPIYEQAAVMGMRGDRLFGAMLNDPDAAMRMLAMFRDGAPPEEADSLPPPGAPETGLAAEDSPPRTRARSGRPIREQVQHNAALLLQSQYRR